MVKIALYDDVEGLRETMVMMLNLMEDFEVVGSFDNCATVVTDIKELQPDVILMDIDMPGLSGIEGVKAIRQVNSDVKVLMLTVFDDNKNVFEAIRAGANGYLLKKTAPHKLIEYIKEVNSGGAPMTASIATQVLKMFTQSSNHNRSNYNLSDREKEVLQSLVDGNSYKMVAAEMNISVDTVRSHIRNIYDKLHVNSKSEAVAKALKDKIL